MNQAIANRSKVDLGGSLAVASRGLFATGVSTDLNGAMIFILEGEMLANPLK